MKKQKISGKVYFVGEAGLGQELEKEGYEAFGLEHGDLKTLPTPFTVDPDVKAVVVGLDRCRVWLVLYGRSSLSLTPSSSRRNFSYYKLAYATVCVRQNPGCRFIGTNPYVLACWLCPVLL